MRVLCLALSVIVCSQQSTDFPVETANGDGGTSGFDSLGFGCESQFCGFELCLAFLSSLNCQVLWLLIFLKAAKRHTIFCTYA